MMTVTISDVPGVLTATEIRTLVSVGARRLSDDAYGLALTRKADVLHRIDRIKVLAEALPEDEGEVG